MNENINIAQTVRFAMGPGWIDQLNEILHKFFFLADTAGASKSIERKR